MDFIAAVVAIVAIVLVIKLRSRMALLEQHVALINQRLATSRIAPPEAAPTPKPTPEPQPLRSTAPRRARARRSRDAEKPRSSRPSRSLRRRRSAAASSASAAPRRAPAKSFEERFGASWVVWIAGLALALGGIFMVQYSIEAGLIGPGVRVFLGGLLATALIAAGEWTRRYEFSLPIASVPTASMPAMLTAAGTTVAFATIYAAYALYGFLGPASAFVLLGIVALATLARRAAAWAVARGARTARRVRGAAAGRDRRSRTTGRSIIYLAVVTAASFALARARLWRWLAITAVAFGVLWTFPGIDDDCASTLSRRIAFHARDRLCARRGAARLRPVLRAGGRGRPHRSGLLRRARRLPVRRRRAGARARP